LKVIERTPEAQIVILIPKKLVNFPFP